MSECSRSVQCFVIVVAPFRRGFPVAQGAPPVVLVQASAPLGPAAAAEPVVVTMMNTAVKMTWWWLLG